MSGDVIDCDVHCRPSLDTLIPYLSDYWGDYLKETGYREPRGVSYTYPAWSEMLATPEADYDAIATDVLGPARLAILQPYWGVESVSHPYLATALSTAINDWVQKEWLDRDARLLASAVLPLHDTQAAIEELERIAADRRFVQLLLPAQAPDPYGHRRYWPLWEAAERAGLTLGIAYGGTAGTPTTSLGYPETLFEEYGNASTTYQAHLASMVIGGVFEQFPQLKVVLMDSGWTWLPALFWRMDREWKALRREVPWVKELPSDYVRRHVRVTSQPIDAPGDQAQLDEIVAQLESDDMLMFGSDYPHRYADPGVDLLAGLDADAIERVRWTNAWECYGLGARDLGTATSVS